MEWTQAIIPITMILVQILKQFEVDNRWLPVIAVVIGALLGFAFSTYYQQDMVELIISGAIYGASAAGIYDLGSSVINKE